MVMLSTPPPMMESTPSLMIWWAATVMACRPDEQKRFMVVPATLVGRPASMALVRPMFWPCAPCGWPQPRMTSSISAASNLGVLAKTSLMQWATKSSGRVRLKEPRKDLAKGVRELATTTASLIFSPVVETKLQTYGCFTAMLCDCSRAYGRLSCHAFFLTELGEGLALLCKPLQQRGG